MGYLFFVFFFADFSRRLKLLTGELVSGEPLHAVSSTYVLPVMYVCVYVRTYACMHVCMYACRYVCVCVRTYVCVYYVCLHSCMYVCVCMDG